MGKSSNVAAAEARAVRARRRNDWASILMFGGVWTLVFVRCVVEDGWLGLLDTTSHV